MIRLQSVVAAMVVATCLCSSAIGDVTITQGTSAPTYTTTLNFDEPGGPTGIVSPDSWQSIGVTELQAGDGVPQVDDWATINAQPWIGTGNSFFGNFGVFMTFANDLTEMSLQVWDPSGPPSPFGGGIGVFVFDDGAEVANYFGTPAWGGIGDEWLDITTSNGMVFDEVRVLGFGFPPTTYADNLSWNVVPEPAGFLLTACSLLALVACRRKNKS